MKAVYRIIRFCLITAMSLIVGLAGLLATETGSRFVLMAISSQWQSLQIGQINGTLLGPLQLNKLQYTDDQGFNVVIGTLNLDWEPASLFQRQLHIIQFSLQQIAIEGLPQEDKQNREVSLPLPVIPIDIIVDVLSAEQVSWKNGPSKTQIQHLSAAFEWVDNQLDIRDISLAMASLQVEGKSRVLIQQGWPLVADINWTYVMDNALLEGQLQLDGNLQQMTFSHRISGAVVSRQTGVLRFDGAKPEFDIKTQWRKLQWPFSGKPQISSQQGTLHIKGSTSNYLAQLDAVISPSDYSDSSLIMTATGDLTQLKIKLLQLHAKQGRLKLNGRLNWQNGIGFDLDAEARKINPQIFGAPVAGKLNLNAHAHGNIVDENMTLTLDLKRLNGQLQGQNIDGSGEIELAKETLHFKALNLRAGRNELWLTGWLNQQHADLLFNIAASDLKTAWPTLAGTLNGAVSIKGALSNPIVHAKLRGQRMRYNDFALRRLVLDADYVHQALRQSTVNLLASGLVLAETVIDKIEITGHGSQARHAVKVRFEAPFLQLLLDGDGRWDNTGWHGLITRLGVSHPQLKKWRLRTPVTINLQAENGAVWLDLSETCLQQASSSLCFTAAGNLRQKFSGHVVLVDNALRTVTPWLPPEVSINGQLHADSQFSVSPEKTRAAIRVNLKDGQVILRDDKKIEHRLQFSASKLEAIYENDQLRSDLYLGVTEHDFIRAHLNAGPAEGRQHIRTLTGEIDAEVIDMTFIDSLLSSIKNLDGQFKAHFNIAGNSAEPLLSGRAQFHDGHFDILPLGITAKNVFVDIKNAPDNVRRLSIVGGLSSGKGTINTNGYLDVTTQNDFPMYLKVEGEKFLIVRLAEGEVVISPNISVTTADKLTKIEGNVSIDSGKIEIKDIPDNVVAPSEDEVVIGAENKKTKPIKLAQTAIDVAIFLGEQLYFSGFGLKTKLVGKLRYVADQDKQSLQGKAEMKGATYKAYGQELVLRRGEFLFNGPADNPWMNIEAVRKAKSEPVVAILSVTGPLKNPYSRIYTEPSLPESDALAYLVTGKSFKQLGQGDSAALANAAISYGAGQLSWITEQLGLDEFEFVQADTLVDSAVKLGHYLNPDLYVGVTMGLFANRYAVDLRYRLNKYLSVHTRSGETQRIDLKYHFSSD
ncbi:translocation/assembly module TamB domain-containing protein [methane-oxidizing endosymbiont of Gigantopelta aegis]|uniref:translocation/assembly module TamB domain-containing protein n=1 Tax=methane-oxidizing endosymbiont of Gigantopelta aegis TaxID=2794938 RepID=UPI0018DD4B65|nr:translocation/assembly module TamB domain-containing protein [methane-oxidizing endosymbiont of Gigantopelta aegis]